MYSTAETWDSDSLSEKLDKVGRRMYKQEGVFDIVKLCTSDILELLFLKVSYHWLLNTLNNSLATRPRHAHTVPYCKTLASLYKVGRKYLVLCTPIKANIAYLFTNVGLERRTLGQPLLCGSLQDYPHHLASRKRLSIKREDQLSPTPLYSQDKTDYVISESREVSRAPVVPPPLLWS